jgi:hypothetical protein
MKLHVQFFLLCLTHFLTMSPVSFVYNLRIAETTKRQALEEKFRKPTIVAATIIGQVRTTYNHTHQTNNGVLATIMNSSNSFYLRADTAFAHVKERFAQLRFSRTQTDDIIFSAGYTRRLQERTRATLSALLGIPTHKNVGLEGIQFGTGHVGIGLQADGSYLYSKNKQYSILGAARFVHFFPRTITFRANQTDLKFNANIGNLTDLFIAHYSNWRRHKWEFGYNATFAFGAYAHSSNSLINEVISDVKFIRSSFYTTYKFLFLINKFPSGIIVGFSYSFDHTKKPFTFKNGYTTWLSWGINF